MSAESSASKVWIAAAAVVSAIAIFAATFYTYAERQRLHLGGSYAPAVIGIVAFSIVMVALTVAMLPKEKRTAWRVLGIAALEVAAFSYAIMFLLLNIYGS